MILPVAWQHGAELVECGGHRRLQRSIRELLHQFAADKKRYGLLRREHHRWQLVALQQTVTDPGLAGNGHARLAERGDVAIDRALGDPEVHRQIGGAHDAPPLQVQHHRDKPVGPIHIL